MNIKMVLHTIGKLLIVEASLLTLPLIVSLIYKENTYWSFIIPIIGLLVLGILLTKIGSSKLSELAQETVISKKILMLISILILLFKVLF